MLTLVSINILHYFVFTDIYFFIMFWNLSGFEIADHSKGSRKYNIWALRDTNRDMFFYLYYCKELLKIRIPFNTIALHILQNIFTFKIKQLF